ncbi:envoplakin-like [Tubulanus polymorphus]|uniref:envoplakin-like n=1 Tax=Tubulanus polymorphus TaxID=672921 RepID=UPI003DA31D7F
MSFCDSDVDEEFMRFCSEFLLETQKNILQPGSNLDLQEDGKRISKILNNKYDLSGKGPGILITCLNVHLENIRKYQQFQNKLSECKEINSEIEDKQYNFVSDGKDPPDGVLQILYDEYVKLKKGIREVLSLSNEVCPIKKRTVPLMEPVQAKIIAAYDTIDRVETSRGQDIRLLENTDAVYWKVQLEDGSEVKVPSLIVSVPPPDSISQRKTNRFKDEVDENIDALVNFCTARGQQLSLMQNLTNLKTNQVSNGLSDGVEPRTPVKKPRAGIIKRIIEVKQTLTEEHVEEDITETLNESSSSGESRSRFTISGVVDPRDNQRIMSIQQAVEEGVVNLSRGFYINPVTNESIPIPQAMGEGLIQVDS